MIPHSTRILIHGENSLFSTLKLANLQIVGGRFSDDASKALETGDPQSISDGQIRVVVVAERAEFADEEIVSSMITRNVLFDVREVDERARCHDLKKVFSCWGGLDRFATGVSSNHH